MRKFFILMLIFVPLLTTAEEYVDKVELFIPYGEADSLIGYHPPYYEIKEDGDTGHIEPGIAVAAWDVQNGKVYVSDGVKKKILVYTLDGKYLRSIGLWKEDTDEIELKTFAGEVLNLKAQSIQRYDPDEKKLRLYPETKYYYEKIGLVAVDGSGNIYAITDVSLKERGAMKFSPDGRLLGIINKFGNYGPDDIKILGFQVRSDAYGDIIVGMLLETGGGIFARFDDKGNLIAITHNMYYPRDANGRYYKYIKENSVQTRKLRSSIKISVESEKARSKEDTLNIKFDPPNKAAFRGVDGEGNLFFGLEPMYRKYDQNGNLLAKISSASIVYEKALIDIRSIPITKFMADGSFYIGFNLKGGFHLIKYYIKPGTEGEILKPAIPDTTKKKWKLGFGKGLWVFLFGCLNKNDVSLIYLDV